MIKKEELYIGQVVLFENVPDVIKEIHDDYVLLVHEPDDFKVSFEELEVYNPQHSQKSRQYIPKHAVTKILVEDYKQNNFYNLCQRKGFPYKLYFFLGMFNINLWFKARKTTFKLFDKREYSVDKILKKDSELRFIEYGDDFYDCGLYEFPMVTIYSYNRILLQKSFVSITEADKFAKDYIKNNNLDLLISY